MRAGGPFNYYILHGTPFTLWDSDITRSGISEVKRQTSIPTATEVIQYLTIWRIHEGRHGAIDWKRMTRKRRRTKDETGSDTVVVPRMVRSEEQADSTELVQRASCNGGLPLFQIIL